ncbi:hypothetical protein D210916BOD24_00540 [Alteromonas sp. D210916BOD_24]
MVIESEIYQRVGEFVVSFQWIENKLREIGWFIIDPERKQWPPLELRKLSNHDLINEVQKLFIEALPKCNLPTYLEEDFLKSFHKCAEELHALRKYRNRVLHSAYIEIKGGGEKVAILRSNPIIGIDENTEEYSFDQESLGPDSFKEEMVKMAEVSLFLNRAFIQLVHQYPNGGSDL